ncbi:MAG: hypothetical protein K6E87_01705 [bacterium]|nr:hypothetical protein [bacterium]
MEKKKFKNYYLDGIKNSYKSLYKRKTNIFKYYICIFIYILSIPLFILKPVVNMGIFRLGEQINDDNDIDLTTITKSCDNPKNYFTALFACLIKIFIITGIILVLLAIAGILALIGYIFMIFTESEGYLFIVLFASPALLAIVIYLLFVPLIYAETGYIVNANNNINASNVINISFNAYKKEGKRIRFGIIALNTLIKVIYLAVAGIGSALPIIIKGTTNNAIGFTIICGIVALIPFIILAPLFTLATISSLTMLNDDVVKDTLTEAIGITNVKFTIPKKDIEELTPEEKLVYLFDNADDLKLNIKNLRILDTLETVDVDGNVDNSNEKQIKKEEKEKIVDEKPNIISNEEIEEENIIEEQNDVEEQTNLEEKINTIENETPKEENFEAIKEASDEIFTDSIIEDVNSEKINDEVTEKLESEPTSDESNEFEAIKETSGDASNDIVEENKTDDETVLINDVVDEKEEIEVKQPDKDESAFEEESTNQEESEIEENNSDVEDVETSKPIIENDNITSIDEETSNLEEKALESENLEQKEIENEIDDILNNKEEQPEEDFDMDLFKEEEKDDETLKEMEDFLKKGDD